MFSGIIKLYKYDEKKKELFDLNDVSFPEFALFQKVNDKFIPHTQFGDRRGKQIMKRLKFRNDGSTIFAYTTVKI